MRALPRAIWRYWITGQPVYGAGDNATFLRDATTDFRGGPRERLSRARWRRVARRWGLVAVPTALSMWHWWAGAGYLTALAAGAGYYGYTFARRWWSARDLVIPAWVVAAKVVGAPTGARHALRAVEIVDGDEEQEATVRIHFPLIPLDESMRKKVVAAVGPRLGIPDPQAAWTVRGSTAFLELTPRVHPPQKLAFAEVRQLYLDASPSKPLVGMGPKRMPVYADLDNDGPHMGISGGSGTGKSALLRMVLSKRVASGAGLIVCDYKVISHGWARKIAREDPHRVLYLVDEEPISEAILALYAEFERRRGVLKTAPEELGGFRPVDLLVEELNSLAGRLKDWWGTERRRILAEAKAYGEDPPYVPVIPPAVSALAALVQMGRELGIRVHFAAQRLDASALSPKDGGAIRESITNRFLAKYTKSTWNMLAAGVPYVAFPGGPRGIWVAVVGGEVTPLRVPLMTEDQAYAEAMSGPAPLGPVLGGARLVQPHTRRITRVVPLKEAVGLLPACPSLDGLRKAVQRAALEPVGRRGNADLFELEALEGLFRVS